MVGEASDPSCRMHYNFWPDNGCRRIHDTISRMRRRSGGTCWLRRAWLRSSPADHIRASELVGAPLSCMGCSEQGGKFFCVACKQPGKDEMRYVGIALQSASGAQRADRSSRGHRSVAKTAVQVINAVRLQCFVSAEPVESMCLLCMVDAGKGEPPATRVWRTNMCSTQKRLAVDRHVRDMGPDGGRLHCARQTGRRRPSHVFRRGRPGDMGTIIWSPPSFKTQDPPHRVVIWHHVMPLRNTAFGGVILCMSSILIDHVRLPVQNDTSLLSTTHDQMLSRPANPMPSTNFILYDQGVDKV